MTAIKRAADAVWTGEVKSGDGKIHGASGVLDGAYSFGTRFEQQPGTNPEELLAAAHAACYSMALALTLGRAGHKPQEVRTHAVCSVEPQQPSGFKITKMQLETTATVPGLDDATFQQVAREAERACPVSNALRGNLAIELSASLASAQENVPGGAQAASSVSVRNA